MTMLDEEKTHTAARTRRLDAPIEGAKPKRVVCPKARTAKFGQCLRVGCGHVAGLSVRVCNCCMAQIGITERDALGMRRFAARYSRPLQAEVIELEDKYLAILNTMPARRPVDRQRRKT